MSLARLALRIVTARALKGATLAGTRVYDSAVEPIDLQVRDNREPFLVVLTDEHDRSVTGRDLRHGTDTCELVIEIAVAARVPVDVPDVGATTEVIIPHTDAGMELVIDLVGHQITDTLMSGASVWSRLWQKFVMRATRIGSRRGASSEGGVRFAARQIVITTDLMADPVRGQALPGPWAELIAAMEADAELAGLAIVIRHAIEGDALLTDEAMVASLFAISAGTVNAMSLTPIRDLAGDAVDLVEVVVDQEDTAPDLVLTEAAADEQGV